MNNVPNYPLDLQLFRHARHAYAPSGTQPGDEVMPGCKLFVPFTADHDYAYSALYEDLLVISFRGSNLTSADPMDGIKDWISNANCKMMQWQIAGAYNVTVHEGFLNGWNSLRQQIFDHVKTIQAVKKIPIVCVGHSRGTISALAALELGASYRDVDVLTWGAPLITASDGVELSRRLIRRAVLYVNKGDPVAGIPLRGPQPHDPEYTRWDGLVELKGGVPPKPVRYGWMRRTFNKFGHWIFTRIREPEIDPAVIEQTAYLHEPALYEQNMINCCKQ